MYNDFFGFRENPFPVTPDPRIFFSNSVYHRTYANLLYGICERKGVIILTGEAGTGKTTLLRRLMNNLEHTVHFAFCPYTMLSFPDLVDFICTDLGLPRQLHDCTQQIKTLQQFLINQQLRGQYAALLIDEAHDLQPEVLVGLAQLATVTAGDEILLPIVLAGQEELKQHLEHPHVTMLQRQIAITCQLDRLKTSEVGPFIYHRLHAIGYAQQDLFPPATVQRISAYAQGIPRAINIICDNALLIASLQATKIVTTEIIEEVARDLQLIADRSPHTEQYISQPVTLHTQHAPPAEQRQRALVNLPLAREKSAAWRGFRVLQRESHFVLWAELGVAAVLFFLLFFRSAPVPNTARPPLPDSVAQSTVVKPAPSPLSTQDFPKETLQPRSSLQKQVKKKSDQSVSPRGMPQITIATLFKSPASFDSERFRKNWETRRDPFAITLPTNKGKDSRILTHSQSPEPSLSPITTNAPADKRIASLTAVKPSSLNSKQESYSDTTTKPSREEKESLSPQRPSLREMKKSAPLMVAVMRGQTTVVRNLLKSGAAVNTQTRKGRTALMFAALTGRSEILQDLIKRGAAVNMKNTEGWTALMYAAWNGHAKAVQTLIKSGAQIDTKNSDGGTALTHAMRNGHHEIARFLRTGQTRPSGTGRSDKSAASLDQSKDRFRLR